MDDLLLHVCCAHCAAYTVDYWTGQGCRTTAFWYNPNIHPFQEHNSRLQSLLALLNTKEIPTVVSPDYEFSAFFRAVAGHEEDRCRRCFKLRLSRTAQVAKEKGFTAFSTTLLISPHQKHDLIRETGQKIAEETGVAFKYHDLRRSYSASRVQTKPLGMYRQKYCGCLYSEYERFANTE